MNFLFFFFFKIIHMACIHWSHKFCIWKKKHPIPTLDKTDHPLSLSHVGSFSFLSPSGLTGGHHHHVDPRHKEQLKNGFHIPNLWDPTQKWVKKIQKKRVAVGATGEKEKKKMLLKKYFLWSDSLLS